MLLRLFLNLKDIISSLITFLLLFGCGPQKVSPSSFESLPSEDERSEGRMHQKSNTSGSLDLEIKTTGKIAWEEKIVLKKFGLSPNGNLEGKTLRAIVESTSPGRDDGKLCSECHNNREAKGGYGLEVAKNATSSLKNPKALAGTDMLRPWAGKDGWADRFFQNATKPKALRLLMKAWMNTQFKEGNSHARVEDEDNQSAAAD